MGKTPLTFTFGGTRYWKTGFYYIAAGAGVSIVMAYLDYDKKSAGWGQSLTPRAILMPTCWPSRRFMRVSKVKMRISFTLIDAPVGSHACALSACCGTD